MANFDQERFNAAVMNWISEASTFLYHDVAKNEGGKKIIADATQQCWNAYGRDTTIIPPKPEPEKKKKNVPTLNSKLSSAEICRANGWVVGDILAATDLNASTLCVRITGIGETHIFVRRFMSLHGECGNEYVLQLECRDWYRLPQPGDVTEKPENSDTAAAPVATGDITRKPDALLVLDREGFMRDFFTDDDAARKFAIQLGGTCVPLYRDPPPPALTDAEREAIKVAADLDEQRADLYGRNSYGLRAATLRGLLDRLGGEQ